MAANHALAQGGRRLGLDAVAEVEDKGLVRKGRKQGIDRAIERGTSSNKRERIHVALHRERARVMLNQLLQFAFTID
jgi:hypothetical protein